jgi:ABC-2 type transport system ATP-binding protein
MFVKEYLSFIAAGHELKNPANRINEVIEQTGLGLMQTKKINQLSKGYKQRVGMAAAIIHAPILLLLDEPTAGLDPNQLTEIRALIKSLSATAMILFSTHILQEVAAICDRVLVLNKGKLVANDSIAALAQKHEAGLEEIFKMLTH